MRWERRAPTVRAIWTTTTCDGPHRPCPWPRDPRFARQPDGRGRRGPRVGRAGAGGRAIWGIDRRPRGGRVARRRPAPLRRQGRAQSGGPCQRGNRGGAARRGRERPAGHRRAADQPRRDREQVTAGRECGAGCVAGGRSGSRAGGRPTALSLPGRRPRAADAGADDEHPQWRAPRADEGRFPGIHGRSGRRPELFRRTPLGDGGLSRAKGDPARARTEHRAGRRRRVRPGARRQ